MIDKYVDSHTIIICGDMNGSLSIERNMFLCSLGVKPLIHQSELGTYTKVVPFQEKSSFHFLYVLSKYQGMFKILQ
jgi:hypothetical protein